MARAVWKAFAGEKGTWRDTRPAIKKGRAESALPFDLKMKFVLSLKLSPGSCQTDQTKAKKEHGGGFGNCSLCNSTINCKGCTVKLEAITSYSIFGKPEKEFLCCQHLRKFWYET